MESPPPKEEMITIPRSHYNGLVHMSQYCLSMLEQFQTRLHSDQSWAVEQLNQLSDQHDNLNNWVGKIQNEVEAIDRHLESARIAQDSLRRQWEILAPDQDFED